MLVIQHVKPPCPDTSRPSGNFYNRLPQLTETKHRERLPTSPSSFPLSKPSSSFSCSPESTSPHPTLQTLPPHPHLHDSTRPTHDPPASPTPHIVFPLPPITINIHPTRHHPPNHHTIIKNRLAIFADVGRGREFGRMLCMGWWRGERPEVVERGLVPRWGVTWLRVLVGLVGTGGGGGGGGSEEETGVSCCCEGVINYNLFLESRKSSYQRRQHPRADYCAHVSWCANAESSAISRALVWIGRKWREGGTGWGLRGTWSRDCWMWRIRIVYRRSVCV